MLLIVTQNLLFLLVTSPNLKLAHSQTPLQLDKYSMRQMQANEIQKGRMLFPKGTLER